MVIQHQSHASYNRSTTVIFIIALTILSAHSAYADVPIWDSDQKHIPDPEVANIGWEQTKKDLRKWLLINPNDTKSRFQLARVLSWNKEYSLSVYEYKLLLANDPNNTDYLFGLSNTFYWMGQVDESIHTLEKVVALTPTHTDAWVQLIRQLHLNKQDQEAKARLKDAALYVPPSSLRSIKAEILDGALPRNYVISEEPKGKTSHVELGGGYESLNNGYKNWSSSYLDASHQFESGEKIYGRGSDLNRFGVTDATIQAGYTKTFDKKWTTTIETYDSPTAHFSPKWSLMGSARYQLDIPVGIELGYKYSAYSTINNNIGTAAIEWYTGNWRFASTLYVSGLQGVSPTYSGLADISYYYDDKSFFGTMLGYGKQVIVKSPGVYENSETQTYVIRGNHFITNEWAITYDGGVNVQGISYTRTGFNLGLRYVF
jgi:YaiO family outer membrane protein